MAKFDFSELTKFEEDLLELAKDLDKGKHAKKFLRNSGNKLKRRTVNAAKSKTNKRTGNLIKGIKRGKPYKYYVDGSMAVRVYPGSPAFHAHLIDRGHRIVDKNGKEHGFKPGVHFFEAGAKEYEGQYYEDTQKFIDDLLDNHLL
ncbi:HK97 gp10 family phage protein [Tissierella creatinophila]|uniref:HK97 gp10 family phage protein n=1 Tax=Tissierella creatinophila DSM 6911 TaxID=1123403 RepID=A0A1U7M532_TISCR|nr:HK97 gp10 family phage protein [Tissierella creatinophila]OLS02423.1 hypothetical protein TICRE_16120 [Tissierella creatinophila DSM 6911]